ncbi:hypothetical protein Csa_016458 [Cucumis sativus]|uniref:Uncharacterized protein n=1 Tax=Cucumis sativus TaxID=3659 RepID=A0A0A0K4M4_CUCSA|nr:hypothetical protein Csa_016458 [Cucumis sativus]
MKPYSHLHARLPHNIGELPLLRTDRRLPHNTEQRTANGFHTTNASTRQTASTRRTASTRQTTSTVNDFHDKRLPRRTSSARRTTSAFKGMSNEKLRVTLVCSRQ